MSDQTQQFSIISLLAPNTTLELFDSSSFSNKQTLQHNHRKCHDRLNEYQNHSLCSLGHHCHLCNHHSCKIWFGVGFRDSSRHEDEEKEREIRKVERDQTGVERFRMSVGVEFGCLCWFGKVDFCLKRVSVGGRPWNLHIHLVKLVICF